MRFDYIQFKDNFIFNPELSIEEIVEKDVKIPNLNQMLSISENLNHRFKNIVLHNIVEIHLLLLNNEDFSNSQKLDYTKLQRYFMKKYLNGMLKKSYAK